MAEDSRLPAVIDAELVSLERDERRSNDRAIAKYEWSGDKLARAWRDEGIYPIALSSEGISRLAFRLWLAWMERLGQEYSRENLPWLPVGRAGAIMILGHYDPAVAAPPIVPAKAIQKVLLTVEDYERLEATVSKLMASYDASPTKFDLGAFQMNEAFSEVPDFESEQEALWWALKHLLIERSSVSELEALSNKFGLDASDLPQGYGETILKLYQQVPVADPSYVQAPAELAESIPEQVRNSFSALSLVDRCAYFASSAPPSPGLRDRLLQYLSDAIDPRSTIHLAYGTGIAGAPSARDDDEDFELGIADIEIFETASVRLESVMFEGFDPTSRKATPKEIWQWALFRCLKMGCTDLHFEIYATRGAIRVRENGDLMTLLGQIGTETMRQISKSLQFGVGLPDGSSIPRNGAFTVALDNTFHKVRINGMPSHGALAFALRILSKTSFLDLDKLDQPARVVSEMRRQIERPQGLILVTGPTGSGKTTTLYSAIKHLNTGLVKIITLEDPIEIELDGVQQIEINEKAGMTWLRGLDSIMRQDPDIVLIGEVRNKEEADAALRASLTGHLVLATLHTNSAADAITRLVDLGCDLSIIRQSLILSQGQRLVRCLCGKCKQATTATKEEKEMFAEAGVTMNSEIIYQQSEEGCADCKKTGISGRRAIMELIPFTAELAHMLETGAHTRDFVKAAEENGFANLGQAALQRCADGQISFKEAMRHVRF